MNSPLLLPPHQCIVECYSEEGLYVLEFSEVSQRCLVYGAPSQLSLRRMKPEKKFNTPFRVTLIVVSVKLIMFSAIYNIVSDISILSVICVDFLGTHMTTLDFL